MERRASFIKWNMVETLLLADERSEGMKRDADSLRKSEGSVELPKGGEALHVGRELLRFPCFSEV